MPNPAFIGVSIKDRRNRGNIVHAAAARRLLPEGLDYPFRNPWSDEQVETIRNHSHLVIVLANTMLLGADSSPMEAAHSVLAKNIEHADLPIVVLGLGSQAELGQSPRQKIPAGTLRLMQILSERSRSIACRGAFTADVLKFHGVNNAEAIGCQSAFWHGASLPFQFRQQEIISNVAFNYSIVRRESKLIEWGVRSAFTLIGQTEHWEESVAVGGDPEVEGRQQYIFNNTSISKERYREYCRKHFRWFLNIDDWIDFLTSFDLSVGTRFHGNMAALIAGTPALWFDHDQRTRELCERLSLPHISIDDANQNLSIERFAELADFSEFRKNYSANYERFKSYVESAGLYLRH